ncbi:UDP-N-acetylmuramoyl-L-alanine--D-glutamate ligase [Candidatus Peregrinibacteria bacterium]|nr:UDP-N-acetylmuramoyl-L-alanine--D-glutamate ligase [Candidatus Peregrinibacteria bacterium]
MNQRSSIAILGFGVEGRAMFNYLMAHEYGNITICDKNVDLKDKMPEGVSVRLGEDYLNDLDDFDVIIRSPGIKYFDPHIQAAVQAGKEVTSTTAIFFDQCPCPIIGITGTKGKGTTSMLTYLMLKEADKDVHLGGNIGTPAIGFLDDLNKDSLVVFELSSFQLQDMKKSPKYAVLLNTTSDHLDYHADTGEYLTAKESILANQAKDSIAVLNKDYDYANHYKPLVKGRNLWVSVEEKVKNGAYSDEENIYFVEDDNATQIAKINEVKLIGSHNLENILPAVAIAGTIGVDKKDIERIIKTFDGLPHRLQFIKEVKGVKFYNDSIATSPDPSMAAVDSFEAPLTLIAGGYDKGADYNEWALKILTKKNLRTVVLIGDLAEKMESAISQAEEKLGEAEGSPTKVLKRNTFEEAILDAFAETPENGVIILSPAAASFDMFKNYKDRGEQFADIVGKL